MPPPPPQPPPQPVPAPQSTPPRPAGWQPQFTLGNLFLVMVIVAVLAAGGAYLTRALQGDDQRGHFVFIIFVTAGPVLLLVAVSLLAWLFYGDPTDNAP